MCNSNMSNDRDFEAYVCPSRDVIEYACNCSAKPVFLCRSCLVTHFAEPNPHTLISLEQARALIKQSVATNPQHITKLNSLNPS